MESFASPSAVVRRSSWPSVRRIRPVEVPTQTTPSLSPTIAHGRSRIVCSPIRELSNSCRRRRLVDSLRHLSRSCRLAQRQLLARRSMAIPGHGRRRQCDRSSGVRRRPGCRPKLRPADQRSRIARYPQEDLRPSCNARAFGLASESNPGGRWRSTDLAIRLRTDHAPTNLVG